MLHHNAVTGLAYQGGNQVILAMDSNIRGFKSYEWATFLQWKQAGFNVKKGEKAGSHIVKFVTVDKKTKKSDGSIKISEGAVPRGYAIFNREQVEPITKMVNSGAVGLAVAR